MRLCIVMYLMVLTSCLASSRRISVCIKNCSQCKQMFGHYFHGEACAASCIASKGSILPDCNNPHTLRGLILRLY